MLARLCLLITRRKPETKEAYEDVGVRPKRKEEKPLAERSHTRYLGPEKRGILQLTETIAYSSIIFKPARDPGQFRLLGTNP